MKKVRLNFLNVTFRHREWKRNLDRVIRLSKWFLFLVSIVYKNTISLRALSITFSIGYVTRLENNNYLRNVQFLFFQIFENSARVPTTKGFNSTRSFRVRHITFIGIQAKLLPASLIYKSNVEIKILFRTFFFQSTNQSQLINSIDWSKLFWIDKKKKLIIRSKLFFHFHSHFNFLISAPKIASRQFQAVFDTFFTTSFLKLIKLIEYK